MQRAALVGIWAAGLLLLHAAPKRPDFKEYPPHGTFGGKAAEPRITTAWQRTYTTRIRLGAAGAEGFRRGAEYIEMAGPNFAGHYRVVNWGCGSGCLMMVVVDLNTGTVYPPPMLVGPSGEDRLMIPNLGTGWGDFDFRVGICGTPYFVIEPRGFRTVQRVSEELLPAPQ